MSRFILVVALIGFAMAIGMNFYQTNNTFASEEGEAEAGEELTILETQLNKNSITGILQNPYDHIVAVIMVQAEFYDKDDGHLVGVRNFGYSTVKDELDPGEKTTYKIPESAGDTGPFPNTPFTVTARGIDMTNQVPMSFEELIGKIENLGKALDSLPDNVYVNVTPQQAREMGLNFSNSTVANTD